MTEAAGGTRWDVASLWSAHLGRPANRGAEPLLDGRSADVVVIGAGVTGLLTAVQLHRQGATVLVLDRHGIGGAATRNSTAKVAALQGVAYRTIGAARGPEVAVMYAAAQLLGVADLRRLIGELGIDCRAVDAPAYTYATTPDGTESAARELTAAKAAGLPVTWAADTELPFEVTGAVRLDDQFHLDPALLCLGLAGSLDAGAVAGGCVVTDVEESRDGCVVSTATGGTVTADHVVVATQSPIVDPALLANRCRPVQSYAIAVRPGTGRAVPTGMYLSCDDTVRSIRPAVDRDGEPVVVVGGEGHEVGADEANPDRWQVLAEWARVELGAGEVTHRWATHDLVPTDHVPFVGRLAPGADRRWVATGFAKWGFANASAAAHLLAAGIGGQAPPEWAPAFDSTRVAASVNRELLTVSATAAHHLVGDRVARRREPRCTHQGCVLRADVALGTWDCPCHGSRFEADGRVVQGPAVRDLEAELD